MGDCILLKERIRTSENEAHPGILTWISSSDKTLKRHVSLISARHSCPFISMQIIQDGSAQPGEPHLGTRNPCWCFLAQWVFLSLQTTASAVEEYLITPDNLKGRDDRALLLRVWQEHTIKTACSLQETMVLQGERTYNKNHWNSVFPGEIGTYFFLPFPHVRFSLCFCDPRTWMQVLVSFSKEELCFYTFQWPGMELQKVKKKI